MSYPTVGRLQRRESRTQESPPRASTCSAFDPSCIHIFHISALARFPGSVPWCRFVLLGLTRTASLTAGLSSPGHSSAMLTARRTTIKYTSCRPERRHISFAGILKSHEPDISSLANLCTGRPRLRARRGRLAHCRERRSLSRFHFRGGCQCAWSRSPEPGRGNHRAGQETIACFESLSHSTGRAACCPALRGELCRSG